MTESVLWTNKYKHGMNKSMKVMVCFAIGHSILMVVQGRKYLRNGKKKKIKSSNEVGESHLRQANLTSYQNVHGFWDNLLHVLEVMIVIRIYLFTEQGREFKLLTQQTESVYLSSTLLIILLINIDF